MGPSRPSRIGRLLPRRAYARTLSRKAGRSVLLTFDDGPHPETTTAVLDLLERYHARAVFFVVGNRIARAPETLREIVLRGHALGNHSYTHAITRRTGYRKYLEDIRLCQEEVFRQCQVRPKLHRPPLGLVSPATYLAPMRMGLRNVLWSYSSDDWQFRSDQEAVDCAEAMGRNVQPGEILLFHDEQLHTVAALDRLLPQLVSRRFRLDVNTPQLL